MYNLQYSLSNHIITYNIKAILAVCFVLLFSDGFMGKSPENRLKHSLNHMKMACFWSEKVIISRETILCLFGMAFV